MGARDEILAAVQALTDRNGQQVFTVQDVVAELRSRGSTYADSTVRTFVTSVMRINAPSHHGTRHADLERVDRGLYRKFTPVVEELAGGEPRVDGAVNHARRPQLSRHDRADRNTEQLIEAFPKYIAVFERARPFTGPSIYFHERAIDLLAAQDTTVAAVTQRAGVEALYATLTSWGMHRMGPGAAKLVDFDLFWTSLKAVATDLQELQRYVLADVGPEEVAELSQRLWGLILRVEASASKARLVAGTKTLHHLLPKLVPPMDRQYTAQFFYGPSGKAFPMGERAAFTEMYHRMARIARECRESIALVLDRHDAYMTTSATKVIDNAIVGYVLASSDPTREIGKDSAHL